MLGLKLNHVSNRGHWWLPQISYMHTNSFNFDGTQLFQSLLSLGLSKWITSGLWKLWNINWSREPIFHRRFEVTRSAHIWILTENPTRNSRCHVLVSPFSSWIHGAPVPRSDVNTIFLDHNWSERTHTCRSVLRQAIFSRKQKHSQHTVVHSEYSNILNVHAC